MFSGIGMGLSLQSPPPILKGATANGNGGTLTLPSHSVGDLIILYASECNGGTGDAMTIPTASGTVPTWTAIGSGGSTWYTHRMYYTVATATNHTSGTWLYNCPLSAVVISGQHVSNPIYNSAYAGGDASTTSVISASSMSGYSNSVVIFSSVSLTTAPAIVLLWQGASRSKLYRP